MTAPIRPEQKAKLNLDKFIADWMANDQSRQAALQSVVGSGMVDTLQQILGPHQITSPYHRPNSWDSHLPWGNILALNQGADAKGATHVAIDPGLLIATQKAIGKQKIDPLDPNYSLQLPQTVGHEFGHTAEEKAGLFPKMVEAYGGPQVQNLLQQWREVVEKRQSGTPAYQKAIAANLDHDGWWRDSNGDLKPGASEMFADSFSQALELLRADWGQTTPQGKLARLRSVESGMPGTTYLMKWLLKQTPYKSHPFGDILFPHEPATVQNTKAPPLTTEDAQSAGYAAKGLQLTAAKVLKP